MLAKITALKGVLLLFSLIVTTAVMAQRKVQGRVTGPDSKPIYGATVAVKGTNVATSTSTDGNYSLTLPVNSGVLVFSYVGYEVAEVNISGNTNLTDVSVVMKPQTTSLNEVVVTGYSSQRKKDITGSVSVVNVNNLKVIPSGTTESLLQGQASGVTVINSGVPGGGSNVRVRGITSIGSTDPLVIIDGTPGSLHDLNVNDIESIQVLKDAGAASIYGVRGSNGVIVVTTKKGRPGKAKVSYDAYYGTQRPLKNGFNIASPQETVNAIWSEYKNDGINPSSLVPGPAAGQFGNGATPVIPDYITPTAGSSANPLTADATYKLYTNQITKTNKTGTDWFHEIFQPAPIQSHSVSVSGGSDKSSYLFSLGYFNQQGTLIETYLKRYSARLNTVFNIKDNIRIGENLYAFYKQSPGFGNLNEGNAISYTYRESPLIPIYDTRGNYAGSNSKGFGNPQNPVANQQRTHLNKSNDWQLNGNAFAEVDFLKHFTARTSFGGTVDNYYFSSFSYTQYENAENNTNPNAFAENFGYNTGWTWTNTLRYSNIFLQKHSVTVLVGSEAIKSYGRAIQGRRGGYFITNPGNLTVDPNLWTLNFGPPSGQTTGNINGTPYQSSLYSLFGRLDYGYNDKYLVSATVRRDGSSIFAEKYRFGVFPSFTGAWRVSHEKFMEGLTWLNDLKLRGGWGKLGSLSNTIATNAFSLYNQTAANSYYDIFGNSTSSTLGIYASQQGNEKASWEEDIITNIGFDATIMKNKLDISLEWYKKDISGLLFRANLPAVAGGATAPFINAGNIKNTGIDASATYHGTVKDLRFDVTGTFTSYKNSVVSLPPGIQYYDRNSAGSTRIGAFSRIKPGEALGAFFGYQQIGIFQSAAEVASSPTQAGAAPGFLKFKDISGPAGKPDGVIDVNDRTFFGNPNPKFTYGLNLAATYKNFDFSMFLYGVSGNDVINYVKYWLDFPQVFDAAIGKDVAVNSWTPTNTGAKIPMLSRRANFSTSTSFSSYYMEKGSYLRCKSLIIGYTLPTSVLRRFGIDRVRFYGQAVNLFTITKYTGLDPELTGSNLSDNTNFGIDFGNYPANQKGYNIGINLLF
jgi:TonB-linked SusC/RagA family outer membrane protein